MRKQELIRKQKELISLIAKGEKLYKDIVNEMKELRNEGKMGYGFPLQELEWLRADEDKSLGELRNELMWVNIDLENQADKAI